MDTSGQNLRTTPAVREAYEKVKDQLTSQWRASGWWSTLFDFYNLNHKEPLRMTCRPCFGKVLAFVKFKIQWEDKHEPEKQGQV